MKKAIGISLIIFWTVLVALVSAGLTDKYGRRNRFGQSQPIKVKPGTRLDAAEVSRHAVEADCWMIIAGKVYDLTGSIAMHPGGAGEILKYCGQDGTQAFKTKDRQQGSDHSTNAYDMLKEYYLGEVGQVMPGNGSASPSATTFDSAATTTPKTPVAVEIPKVALTMAEVSRHNKQSDCWFVISKKVYNVTKAISDHPGGSGTITKHCGQEATKAFATKDYGKDHSSGAYAMLKSYYIGDLGQQIAPAKALPSAVKPAVNPAAAKPPVVAAPSGGVTLNTAEVAKHGSSADCWMVISNKIYSLSAYISSHPGGANNIIRFCGQDGTAAFATKGQSGGSNHSSNAHALLASYYIGDLGQVLPGSQLDTKINQVNTAPQPGGGESEIEDEEEDD